MKIAPIDIAHKSFSRKMMGFDAEEVMEFLREVSDEMEQLIRERNTLKENLRDKDLQINEFRERDELLKHTITTATKMSEKIHIDAEREAHLVIGDAKQKSEMIVSDARDSLRKIYAEIADLKRVRLQYEHNLRALVNSHLTMLEQGREVMPDPSQSYNIDNSSIDRAISQATSGRLTEEELLANVTEAVGRVTKDIEL